MTSRKILSIKNLYPACMLIPQLVIDFHNTRLPGFYFQLNTYLGVVFRRKPGAPILTMFGPVWSSGEAWGTGKLVVPFTHSDYVWSGVVVRRKPGHHSPANQLNPLPVLWSRSRVFLPFWSRSRCKIPAPAPERIFFKIDIFCQIKFQQLESVGLQKK